MKSAKDLTNSSKNLDQDCADDSNEDVCELNDEDGACIAVDPSFIMKQKKEKKYNTRKMKNLAVACERTGISSRSAAILTNAVLEDVGMIEPNIDNIPNDVTDRMKIIRQRKRTRDEYCTAAKSAIEGSDTLGIYYDGKKEDTLMQVMKGATKTRKKVVEEHVTIVLEPDSRYRSHVTPKSGTSKNVCSAIFDEMSSDMDRIKVVGCDGCNVNTGHKGGVIALLEAKVQRALQWSVCLLHMNELPLRSLVKKLDGVTTGPRGFIGSLGRQLSLADSMPVVEFVPIPSDQLCVHPNELSTDQMYLYQIYGAVAP